MTENFVAVKVSNFTMGIDYGMYTYIYIYIFICRYNVHVYTLHMAYGMIGYGKAMQGKGRFGVI